MLGYPVPLGSLEAPGVNSDVLRASSSLRSDPRHREHSGEWVMCDPAATVLTGDPVDVKL